jgi:hypothetical protein
VFQLNRMLAGSERASGQFGCDISGIKLRILNLPLRNLTTIVTELYQLHTNIFYENVNVTFGESFA